MTMNTQDPQHSTRKMGKGMIAAGFVLALALLTTFFDGVLEGHRNPNGVPESTINAFGDTEVVLKSNRQGQYVLTGAINDVETEFILDTGATEVVIPAGLAEASGLRYGYQSQAMTANGLVNTWSTVIDELRLGDIVLHDVRARINPSMHESMVLLGMSALGQVEIVQQGSTLTLRYRSPN